MVPKIHDASNVYIGDLTECSRGIAIEERNGMLEIEIDYHLNSPFSQYLVRGNIIIADVNDNLKNQQFRIYKVVKDIYGNFTVYANHISYDIGRDYCEGITGLEDTCENCLRALFENSKFSQGFTGYSDITSPQTFTITPRNLLEAISGSRGSIIDTFGNGAEILRDNYDFHVLNNRGTDNGVIIEYASNLIGLDYEEDETSLITCIRAFAKYTDEFGIEQTVHTYVTSPKANNYETLFISEIDFSDKFSETTPTIERLKYYAEKYFNDNQCDEIDYNYKVEFVPLSKCVGYEDIQDEIKLCDTVTIIDSRYGLNTSAKVVKTTYNFLKDRYDSIELGKLKSTSLLGSEDTDKIDEALNDMGNFSVKLEILDDKIVSQVARLEGEIETNKTMIQQTDNEIQLVATDLNGKYTSIKQTIDEIDLTGVVKFSDLSTEGNTSINGSNITTGTINANRIDTENLSVSGELLTGVINGVQGVYLGTGASIYGAMYGYKDREMTGGQKWEISSEGWANFTGAQIDGVINANDALNVEKNISCDGAINAYGGINVDTGMKVTSNINTTTDNWRITSDGWCYFKDGGQFASGVTVGGLLTANGNINTKDITLSGTAYITTINSSSYKWRVTSGGWVYASGFESSGNANIGGNLDVSGHTYVGAITGSGWSVSSSGWCYFEDGGQFDANVRCEGRITGGSFYTTGGTYIGSDARLKKNIEYINANQRIRTLSLDEEETKLTTSDMYNFIQTLPLAKYDLIEEAEELSFSHYGFILQDIYETTVGKELVYNNENDEFMSYSSENLIAFLIGALQEEMRRTDELEQRINKLEE